eukprot:8008832-Alexandrium_andersonii.AAC.1
MCLAAFPGRTAPRRRVFYKRPSMRLAAPPARTAALAPLHCVCSSARVAYGVPSARRDIRRSVVLSLIHI